MMSIPWNPPSMVGSWGDFWLQIAAPLKALANATWACAKMRAEAGMFRSVDRKIDGKIMGRLRMPYLPL